MDESKVRVDTKSNADESKCEEEGKESTAQPAIRVDTKSDAEKDESKYEEQDKDSTAKPAAAAAATSAPASATTAGASFAAPNAVRAGVELSIIPERDQVLKGVRNVLKVLCQIKPPKKATERPPFHIAVVLDKSGSMSAENRLRNCKRVLNSYSTLLA